MKKLLTLLFLLPMMLRAETVTLAWDASPDPVTNYVVHIGTSSQNYTITTNAGTLLTKVVENLQMGSTYYFAVTAIGTNSVESDFSNEVNYSVPLPNNQPPVITLDETSKTVNDGITNVQVGFFVTDDYINPDNLNYAVSISNNEIISGGRVLGLGINKTLELDLNLYQIGSAFATVTVSDGTLQASDTVEVTIKSWMGTAWVDATHLSISWPSYRSGILQYKTNLLDTEWTDSPSFTNNPAIFDITQFPMAFFRLYQTNFPPAGPTITSSNTVVSANANSSLTITSSGNDLLVLTLASETQGVDASISSNPSLSWQKVGDADTSSAEIWVAESSSAGSIVVNYVWSGWTSSDCSAVIYAIDGYTTINTTSTTGSAQSTPNLTVPNVPDGSIIIVVSSDWNAVSGTITYRNPPVTEVLKVFSSGAYQCAHWFKEVETGGSIVVGQSAPTQQSAGTVAYVIR